MENKGRRADISRKTRETDISINLNVDGEGKGKIDTGIGFFDHMLSSFCMHSSCDLTLVCKGDLEVDGHHTVEDVGIVLGQAFAEAVADKTTIKRYGRAFIPMDEALAISIIDYSGRPYLRFDVNFTSPLIGSFDTQLVKEFFRAFTYNSNMTLHLEAPYGENDHHICEALFKAFAHAIKEAVVLREGGVLSTKGSLE